MIIAISRYGEGHGAVGELSCNSRVEKVLTSVLEGSRIGILEWSRKDGHLPNFVEFAFEFIRWAGDCHHELV